MWIKGVEDQGDYNDEVFFLLIFSHFTKVWLFFYWNIQKKRLNYVIWMFYFIFIANNVLTNIAWSNLISV